MSEEKEIKKDRAGITRRKFLKDAGIVVGGTAIGSAFFLSACGEKVEVTKTVTTTAPGSTITTTVPGTPGGTVTETKTVTKYICPVCSQEFDTLDALKAHFDSAHEKEAVVQDGVINITVNGKTSEVLVKPMWVLRDVLRNSFAINSVKDMCDGCGACGSCTVIMNGRPVLSCMALATECDGAIIETAESLGENNHPLVEAYAKNFCAQCGYCTPGFIITAKALLDKNPNPSDNEIRDALGGNLCRCGTYPAHISAVKETTMQTKRGT